MSTVTADTRLNVLDLSVRLLHGLEQVLMRDHTPSTYGNALAITDKQLLSVPGIGKGCVAEWAAFKTNPRSHPRFRPAPEASDDVLTGEAEDTEEALLRWKVERLEAAVAQLTKEKQDAVRSATEARRRAAEARDRLEALVSSLTVHQLRRLGVEVSYDLSDLPTGDEED